MQKHTWLTLLAGVAAGVFFAISVSSVAGGLLFFYFPLFPLFLIGLGWGNRPLQQASGIALLLIAAITGFDLFALLLCTFLLIVPVLLVTRYVLLWRGNEHEKEWYPIGAALTSITAYAVAVFIACALFYPENSTLFSKALPLDLTKELQAELGDNPDPQMAMMLHKLTHEWLFMLIASSLWSWVLMVYANGWAANYLLAERGRAIRPSFGLAPFSPPLWWLIAVTLAGIVSLAGGEPAGLIAKTALITLLLPYFLSGLASIHARSASWPGRGLIIFFLYLLLFTQLWMVLPLALYGVFLHIKSLVK